MADEETAARGEGNDDTAPEALAVDVGDEAPQETPETLAIDVGDEAPQDTIPNEPGQFTLVDTSEVEEASALSAFGRWLVEVGNRQMGDERRAQKAQLRGFRDAQDARRLVGQHRKVEEAQQQHEALAAQREHVREQNHAVVSEMRVNLLELKESMLLERMVHESKGRELVDNARLVQGAKLLEAQLNTRGKKQAMSTRAKEERAEHDSIREAQRQQQSEEKRQMTARIKAELAADQLGQSRRRDFAEKSAAGDFIRQLEMNAVEKRHAARHAFLTVQAAKRRAAEQSKIAARSAVSELASRRRQEAGEVRQAKLAAKERRVQDSIVEQQRTREYRETARLLTGPNRVRAIGAAAGECALNLLHHGRAGQTSTTSGASSSKEFDMYAVPV